MSTTHFRDFLERYLAEQEEEAQKSRERRHDPRHPVQKKVRGRLVREFVSLHFRKAPPRLEVSDISRSGAALLSTERLFPGETIEFELELAGGNRRHLRADVMWCSPVGPSLFKAGTRFVTGSEALSRES
jgi:hypothetical protein